MTKLHNGIEMESTRVAVSVYKDWKKILRLIFTHTHSTLSVTLNINMKFGLLPIERDHNEYIFSKVRHVVVVCVKWHRQTPDRKIKQKFPVIYLEQCLSLSEPDLGRGQRALVLGPH